MSKQSLFSRYELKYLIPLTMFHSLTDEMGDRVHADSFGDNNGKYNIVSLYFESPDYTIYYETKNRAPFRQKLRLRVYNESDLDSAAFFEVKQKYRNVVNKRRTAIRLSDAYDWMERGRLPEESAAGEGISPNSYIMNEIASFKTAYCLEPKAIISYTRFAYQGVYEPDLRITFDTSLTCRSDSLRIEEGGFGRYFVDPELVIMEVKVSNSVPLWLTRLLSKYKCPNQSVSKYCASIELLNPSAGFARLEQTAAAY